MAQKTGQWIALAKPTLANWYQPRAFAETETKPLAKSPAVMTETRPQCGSESRLTSVCCALNTRFKVDFSHSLRRLLCATPQRQRNPHKSFTHARRTEPDRRSKQIALSTCSACPYEYIYSVNRWPKRSGVKRGVTHLGRNLKIGECIYRAFTVKFRWMPRRWLGRGWPAICTHRTRRRKVCWAYANLCSSYFRRPFCCRSQYNTTAWCTAKMMVCSLGEVGHFLCAVTFVVFVRSCFLLCSWLYLRLNINYTQTITGGRMKVRLSCLPLL